LDEENRTGVYVAAAVPAAGKFTVYLNKAVTATAVEGPRWATLAWDFRRLE
jgi:hypothetical protein